jgi:hypothetical protein
VLEEMVVEALEMVEVGLVLMEHRAQQTLVAVAVEALVLVVKAAQAVQVSL